MLHPKIRVDGNVGSAGSEAGTALFRDGQGNEVFVQKMSGAFFDLLDSKMVLKEVALLRQLSHDCVVQLVDLPPVPSPDFEDVYLCIGL